MSMKAEHYIAYKDSGVALMGEIPEHWKFVRIKDLISKIASGVTPRGGAESYEDVGIPFLRSQNVHNDGLRLDDVSFISESTHQEMLNSQVKSGDIVFNITGASIARTCIVPEEIHTANISQHIVLLRLRKLNEIKFISYYLQSQLVKDYVYLTQNGASKEAFNHGQMKCIPISLPTRHEQNAIAAYLDTKTSQIDQKINLLNQKAAQYHKLKQSLINETVTRGLDKTARLIDSDVEWIGQVPTHWQVKRVKELFEISRGRVIAQTELIDNGQFPVYSSQTQNNGCLGYINTFDYNGNYITWTTDGVNAGTVFLRSGQFNCTNICGTLKLNVKNCNIRYLYYSLGVSTKHNKRIDTNGAKIMSNEMMFIKICVPPQEEQTAIAIYLDEKTEKIERIINTINTQIDKLIELRKALMNDVVTGKIKVIS